MKKIITLLLAVTAVTAATAGNNKNLPFISFGVKLGVATENTKFSLGDNTSIPFPDKKFTGYHAGAVIRLDIPMLPIFVQPEILYNWGKIKNETWGDIKLNSFNVPVLLGFGLGTSNLVMVRANLGPVFNLTSNATIGQANWNVIGDAFRKPTVSWTAGIGIDIISITFDVRYNGQFKKNETTANVEVGGISVPVTASTKPSSWTFSLGYLF